MRILSGLAVALSMTGSCGTFSDVFIERLPSQGGGARRYERSSYDRRGHRVPPSGFVPAAINRHTGLPHEHKREIARRLRQG